MTSIVAHDGTVLSGEMVAILNDFTRQVVADNGEFTLILLVKPDTDFDSAFDAWDIDDQEWLTVNGWFFEVTDL